MKKIIMSIVSLVAISLLVACAAPRAAAPNVIVPTPQVQRVEIVNPAPTAYPTEAVVRCDASATDLCISAVRSSVGVASVLASGSGAMGFADANDQFGGMVAEFVLTNKGEKALDVTVLPEPGKSLIVETDGTIMQIKDAHTIQMKPNSAIKVIGVSIVPSKITIYKLTVAKSD